MVTLPKGFSVYRNGEKIASSLTKIEAHRRAKKDFAESKVKGRSANYTISDGKGFEASRNFAAKNSRWKW